VKQVISKDLDKYLPIYNKVLVDNGTSGYLVGSSLTLADLGLLEVLLATKDFFGLEVFKDYPGIVKFYEVATSLENVGRYIREIRKPISDATYIDNVRKVLLM